MNDEKNSFIRYTLKLVYLATKNGELRYAANVQIINMTRWEKNDGSHASCFDGSDVPTFFFLSFVQLFYCHIF